MSLGSDAGPRLISGCYKRTVFTKQPTTFSVEEVYEAPDVRFVGTCHDSYVLVAF